MFVLSYGATTIFGATFLLDPIGKMQFEYFIGTYAVQHMATVGGTLYWSILFLPLAAVPFGVIVGNRCLHPLASEFSTSITTRPLWLPSAALILGALTTYSAYKLWIAGALIPLSAMDTSNCVFEKAQRRAELIEGLGNHVYMVLYSALPILIALTSTYAIRFKSRTALVLCGLSVVAGIWLCLALFMKAPILILLLALATASIAAA